MKINDMALQYAGGLSMATPADVTGSMVDCWDSLGAVKCRLQGEEIVKLCNGHKFGEDLVCVFHGCEVVYDDIRMQKLKCKALPLPFLVYMTQHRATLKMMLKVQARHDEGAMQYEITREFKMGYGTLTGILEYMGGRK